MVEWDAHEQADRMSSMSMLPLKARVAAQGMDFMDSSVGLGAEPPPLLFGIHGGSAS